LAPNFERYLFFSSSFDSTELFCTLMGSNPEKVVVVAHPVVVGSCYRQVINLAKVVSFDSQPWSSIS